jgi:hypothetical protein
LKEVTHFYLHKNILCIICQVERHLIYELNECFEPHIL